MNSFDKLSHSLAVKAAPYSSTPDAVENVEILQYGIYLMLTDLSKYAILLTIAYFMDLLTYAAFSLLSIGILRMYIGGVHAETYWGCLIASLICFLGVSYLAKNVIIQATPQTILLSYGVCMFAIIAFAPADHENKPVRSKKQRKHLRFVCFCLATFYLILALILKNNAYSVVLVFALLLNSAFILPLTYSLTGNRSGEFYNSGVNAEGA